jgi:phospholipid/cholesterol/gamma-HCH transport system substrate-binding protein
METRINYMLVGLFVIVASCGLVVAGFWLSIGLSQKQFSTYVVYLDESASGLNVKSPVKYNGVQVGNVGTIKLDNKDPNRVEVFLNIEKGVPINRGCLYGINGRRREFSCVATTRGRTIPGDCE